MIYCPYCRKNSATVETEMDFGDVTANHYVLCAPCGISGRVASTEAEAIRYWEELSQPIMDFPVDADGCPLSTCATCGAPYELVRPGKEQPTCQCDYINDLQYQLEQAKRQIADMEWHWTNATYEAGFRDCQAMAAKVCKDRAEFYHNQMEGMGNPEFEQLEWAWQAAMLCHDEVARLTMPAKE